MMFWLLCTGRSRSNLRSNSLNNLDLEYKCNIYRYNSSTGLFTVPSGGAGLYFLYINFYADDMKIVDFVIRVNGGQVCYARGDQNNEGGAGDNATPSCAAVTTLLEGEMSKNLLGNNFGHCINGSACCVVLFNPFDTLTYPYCIHAAFCNLDALCHNWLLKITFSSLFLGILKFTLHTQMICRNKLLLKY